MGERGEEEGGEGRSEARDLDTRDVRRSGRGGGNKGAWFCLRVGGAGVSLLSEFDEGVQLCIAVVTRSTAREGRDLRWGEVRERGRGRGEGEKEEEEKE